MSSSSSSGDEFEDDDQQDTTLLTTYRDHVAAQIWMRHERGPLNRCINRSWPSAMPVVTRLPAPVQLLVMNSGLSQLVGSSYERVDKRLVTAFVERWYEDTCTFHLPCGEMTITLDDVHSILHVPVSGRFLPFMVLQKPEAVDLVVELLGMERGDAERAVSSGYIKFSALETWLTRCVRRVMIQEATRTYLLYLVGTTLFMNKQSDKVHVHYLEAFRNLDEVHQYAWGASALAYLYDSLCEATRPHVVTIAGNISLLQAWIFEHFPDIGFGVVSERYEEHMPRVFRWLDYQSVGGSEVRFREYTERLTADRVVWTPYDPAHRPHCPFTSICYFSGYLRCGTIRRPHLPERVLRQFGHVQGIPRDPPHLPAYAAVDAAFDAWAHYVIDEDVRGPMMRHVGECTEDYMAWLAVYSHPHLLRTTRRPPTAEERRDALWRERMVMVGDLADRMRQTRILDMDALTDIVTISRTDVTDEPELLTRGPMQ